VVVDKESVTGNNAMLCHYVDPMMPVYHHPKNNHFDNFRDWKGPMISFLL